MGKRKRDFVNDEGVVDRKHRRRDEDSISTRTNRYATLFKCCNLHQKSNLRYETRSDYRRKEELRREVVREREARREYEGRGRGERGEYSHSNNDRSERRSHQVRDSGDVSHTTISGSIRQRDTEKRDRRDVSKKARDRERRYGTDGYKSRRRSSTR